MRTSLLAAATVALSLAGSSACTRTPAATPRLDLATRAEPGVTYRWRFDPAPHFAEPIPSPLESTAPHRQFLAVEGKFHLQRDDAAPSAPWVLRSDGAHTTSHAPRVLVDGLAFDGVRARVKCRIEGGVHESSCGLIVDASEYDRYVVARLDAVDHALHVVAVEDGVEHELARREVPVAQGEWHQLEVLANGADLVVHVDGAIGFAGSVAGEPSQRPRAIGLYSQGDSVVSFDDLEATAIGHRAS